MTTISPPRLEKQSFTDPEKAWEYLAELYHRNTSFIRGHLADLAKGVVPDGRVRACYPQVEVRSTSYSKTESTLPYGFLHTPGDLVVERDRSGTVEIHEEFFGGYRHRFSRSR